MSAGRPFPDGYARAPYARSFKEVNRSTPRAVLRHATLGALSSLSWLRGNWELLSRPRVQFLYLHYVFPDEVVRFRDLLSELSRQHRFISYADGVRRVRTGDIDDSYVCFSFDDGLASCLTAADVLEEFDARACFFVCPGAVSLSSDREARAFCAALNMPPVPLLSWKDVEALRRRGHEIGNHTKDHFDLGRTETASELQDQVGRGAEMLRERLGACKHFAWPRGTFAHFSPAAAEVVYNADHVSCASAVRGCHLSAAPASSLGLCIRRDHVVAGWPLRHSLYFMARNVARASGREGTWPTEWLPE